MDVVRERLVIELVEAALERPAETREDYLLGKTPGDRALLREALDLLNATDTVSHNLPTALPMAVAEFDGPPPARIGPYRIGRLLGRGGMGRVFAADRSDGVFEQAVAIKLMRRALSSSLAGEQFARERQILARLQHRNIAQLFDGGVTEDGNSYFVMELVAGRDIAQYAREEKLTLVATMQLFMQICTALRYAHSRLVVHADIKPSNVIVTDDGSVKLLDFGVARVANAAGEAAPLGLTPEYSSPARRAGEVATTADDVFSLGVMLEELLERSPRPPADLRAIALRARAKNVEVRYQSIEALRDDLSRWLDHRPVDAHRGGWRYVLGKLFSRHRLAMTTGIISAMVLLIAAVALAVLYERARSARERADQRFADARELSHFVLFDIYDRLEGTPRALALRGDIAAAGQRYLDRLAHDPRAPMAVRLEVIEGLRRLAQVQGDPGTASLRQIPQARANLDKAETLARALPADGDDRVSRALVLARVALARAKIAAFVDQDFIAAQRALDASLKLLDATGPASTRDPQVADLRRDIAVEESATLQWQGKYAEAERVARRALDASAAPPAATPANRAAILQRFRLINILAESIYYGGDAAAAERVYRDLHRYMSDTAAALPRDMAVARALGVSSWQLGTTLLELNRGAEAEAILAQGRALYAQLVMLEPDDRELARGQDIVSNAYAQSLAQLHRYSESTAILESSVDARHRLWLDEPTNRSAARDYVIVLTMLADVRADAGQTQLACRDYRAVLEAADRVRSSGHLSQLDEEYGLRLVRERMAVHCRAPTAAPTGPRHEGS